MPNAKTDDLHIHFKNHNRRFKAPVVIYADFETLIEKNTNAYVLFYTKKDTIKSEEENKIKMDIEISNNNNNEFYIFNNLFKNSEKEKENDNENININSSVANIQKDILDTIKIDNFQYWVSKAIFSNDYINFINENKI